MSSRPDIVLDGGIAITVGPRGVIADSEIVIRDDKIQAVRPRARRRRTGSKVIDVRDRVLLPGLFNAHVHSEFLLLKGLVEDRRLREWEDIPLYNRAWRWVRDPANLEHVRHAYRASYLESLAGGVTFIGEFNCADAATAASIEAMNECGIRGIPTVDLGRREKFEAIEKKGCLHAIDDEEGLTEDELRRAGDLLKSHPNARLTMHAAETSERVNLIRTRLGRTTVSLLDAHRLLGPHLLLSHAIHLTPEEIDRIAATRTRVVSSPIAEMKLADGVGALTEMLARGVAVALGSDAAVCNNGCDMFQEMKVAALLQKATRGAHAVSAERALAMGTINGAVCFDRDHELGSLEPGKLADVVAVDARSPRMRPLIHRADHSNVVSNLIFAASAADVRDVWIGGEAMVTAGRPLRFDWERALSDLQSSAEAMHRAIAKR